MERTRPLSTTPTRVAEWSDGRLTTKRDELATEEPMEIRVIPSGAALGAGSRGIAVTMRTPGNDFELAAGFLFTEGLLKDRRQVARISYCNDPEVHGAQQYNIVNVWLRPEVDFDFDKATRHFYAASSCGLCGKGTLESVHVDGCAPLPDGGPALSAEIVTHMPETLRRAQKLFARTGGIHAAGLFDGSGNLLAMREDVGRHNAVDKLLGESFLSGRVPLSDHALMVSGRASFEIMQKAAVARIPVVVAVSAPSSLAVDFARAFNMTLIGFVRGRRFNIYAGDARVRAHSGSAAAVDTRGREERRGAAVLCVVGFSGAGKTTLIEALLPKLKALDLKVGCLKHTHHEVQPGPAVKDSERHRQAGAHVTGLAGPDGTSIFIDRGDRPEMDEPKRVREIPAALGEAPLDLLLVEGLKSGSYPKILVVHPDPDRALAAEELEQVLAVFSRQSGDGAARQDSEGTPNFAMDRLDDLVTLIVDRLDLKPGELG